MYIVKVLYQLYLFVYKWLYRYIDFLVLFHSIPVPFQSHSCGFLRIPEDSWGFLQEWEGHCKVLPDMVCQSRTTTSGPTHLWKGQIQSAQSLLPTAGIEIAIRTLGFLQLPTPYSLRWTACRCHLRTPAVVLVVGELLPVSILHHNHHGETWISWVQVCIVLSIVEWYADLQLLFWYYW